MRISGTGLPPVRHDTKSRSRSISKEGYLPVLRLVNEDIKIEEAGPSVCRTHRIPRACKRDAPLVLGAFGSRDRLGGSVPEPERTLDSLISMNGNWTGIPLRCHATKDPNLNEGSLGPSLHLWRNIAMGPPCGRYNSTAILKVRLGIEYFVEVQVECGCGVHEDQVDPT